MPGSKRRELIARQVTGKLPASYRQVKGATRWTDAKDAAFMNIAHGQDGQEKKDAFMAIREQMKQTKMKARQQMSNHDTRNICDECKTCKDNKQGLTFCFNECYWPIDVLYEVEEKRNQVAADGNDRKN